MRTLEDLKLSKKTKAKVEDWLLGWLGLFVSQADGRMGNVYRADFEKMDFFFFMECNELVSKEVESKGVEDSLKIRRRKRAVMNQLLIRTLLGEDLKKFIKCSHCGFGDCCIGGLPSGGGHYVYCDKCGYTKFAIYPDYYGSAAQEVINELKKKGFNPAKFLTPTNREKCKNCGKRKAKRKVPKGEWSTTLLRNEKEEKFKRLHKGVALCVLYYECSKCGIKNIDNIEELPVKTTINGDFCRNCLIKVAPK